MIQVRTYKANQYVVIGNHLAQHQELSLTAIGLATYILSVPDGTLVDIRTLAERFTEGRERIAAALRELEAHGYLERVREHTAEGRLVTRTYAHHTPARQADVTPLPLRAPAARSGGGRARVQKRGADAGAAQDTSQEGDQAPPPPRPAAARGTVPAQAGETVPVLATETVPGPATEPHPAAPTDTGPVPAAEPHAAPAPRTQTAPAPERAAAPPVPTAPVREAPSSPSSDLGPRDHRHDMAVALLAGLRRTDSRLTLSHRQVNALVPAVVAWLDRGVARAEIYRTLVTGLPAEMTHPAGVLAYRLRELLPPYLPALPERRPEREPRLDDGPHPFQTCDGCERAFRSPAPGRCRDCRSAPAATSEAPCAA